MENFSWAPIMQDFINAGKTWRWLHKETGLHPTQPSKLLDGRQKDVAYLQGLKILEVHRKVMKATKKATA